jgi:nuclear pore complex protein Nup98-Nup96
VKRIWLTLIQPSKKYLRAQDQFTKIHMVKDVPAASLEVSKVRDIFHNEDRNDPAIAQEKRVWELASILFDEIDLSATDKDESQARRQALSDYWADLVRESSTKSTDLAASSEEKAVACLAGHRVAEACKFLLDGKNFRLGTLVALIGSSDAVKKDMREQLKVWRDSKMLSEFSESIRTIYELLSGNVGVCEGMKGVPAEDRIESFVISSKFGLDWKQAFGLRLWYAIAKQDDLSMAVRKFKSDVDQERESKPHPWYIDQGIKPLWEDEDESSRQDLLWGLLQLYADENTDLEAVLRPENSQLSPLDMRLSWQLGQALVSTGKVSYGSNAVEKADAATLAYTSQLTSAGEWLEAIFVILHLSDPEARAKAIKEQLCRHAGQIGPESGPNFAALTQKLQIPSAWVWEALALYMRSVKKDASGEVECLLRAGSFDEAHRVLANEVAPRAIVERDYATLSSLIAQFEGRQGTISGWSSGGEIYSLFLTLLQQRSKGENTQAMVLDRLQAGLHAMNEEVPETDLMRYAAVSDMADETAKEILKLGRKKQVCLTGASNPLTNYANMRSRTLSSATRF